MILKIPIVVVFEALGQKREEYVARWKVCTDHDWWWFSLILVTFPLVLAILHLCGISLDTTTTRSCPVIFLTIIPEIIIIRMSLELKYFWNAYNWVLICIWASHYHYQWSDRKIITDNLSSRSGSDPCPRYYSYSPGGHQAQTFY